MLSILKSWKDPTLPSSYPPISLLDTIVKLLEKIALSRIRCEVSVRVLRDEQFGFRPKHSTTLQLARIVERVSRNFDEKTDELSFPGCGQDLRYLMGRRPALETHGPYLSLVPCQNYILLPEVTDVRSVLPNSHIH